MFHCFLIRATLTGPVIFIWNLVCFSTHNRDNHRAFLLLNFFCFPTMCSFGSRSLLDVQIKVFVLCQEWSGLVILFKKKWASLCCSREYNGVWCCYAVPCLAQPFALCASFIEYPELEGNQEDHWDQLLDPQKVDPFDRRCLTSYVKKMPFWTTVAISCYFQWVLDVHFPDSAASLKLCTSLMWVVFAPS